MCSLLISVCCLIYGFQVLAELQKQHESRSCVLNTHVLSDLLNRRGRDKNYKQTVINEFVTKVGAIEQWLPQTTRPPPNYVENNIAYSR